MFGKLYSFENLDIDVNSSSMLIIVVGIAIGLVIGVVSTVITKSTSGKIVHALLEAGAVDVSSAKTIAELGLAKVPFVKSSLKPGAAVFKAVASTAEPDTTKINWNETRFFLPEEKRISAETRFPKEHHPVMTGVFAVVLIAAVAFFAVFIIPELLTMLDNFITQVKTQ